MLLHTALSAFRHNEKIDCSAAFRRAVLEKDARLVCLSRRCCKIRTWNVAFTPLSSSMYGEKLFWLRRSKMYKNHLLTATPDDLGSEKTSATWSKLLTPTSGNHGQPDIYLFFSGSLTVFCPFPSALTCTRQLFTYIGLMSWTRQMEKKCASPSLSLFFLPICHRH